MPTHRVLILTGQSLVACQWRSGEVRQEQAFSLDGQGQDDFRIWLRQHADTLVHLLVDLPDEAFHQETLPHVSGSDRKAMLERKLNQHFFGTPYTLVCSLGREKQGRRDEHFLFAALTRPQAIEPWLQAMLETGAAVAGIHSPALLLSSLLSREQINTPRLILITLGSGGLRQTYFEHGQLRFSRLKPLATSTIEEAAVNIYGEAVRIHHYLLGQRLIARSSRIPVHCLVHPSHFGLLRQTCADTEELSFTFSDLQSLAEAQRLHTALPESRIDALLVQRTITQRGLRQFGDNSARRDYRRWQWRNATDKATLGVLALAGAFAIAAGVSIIHSNGRSNAAALSEFQAKQRYDNLVRSLPAIPVNPEQLRNLIGRWHELQAHSPDLARSLQPLSTALQQNARIELQKLDWRLSADPDDGAAQGGTWLVMDIEARLPTTLGADRRAQNESVEHFVAALKRSPADNARILQRPFDTDSAKSLKGSSEAYGGREILNFTVRYWRKADTV
jgi:hypothetical protein